MCLEKGAALSPLGGPSSMRLKALVPSRDSRARTRSPSPECSIFLRVKSSAGHKRRIPLAVVLPRPARCAGTLIPWTHQVVSHSLGALRLPLP